MISTKTNIVIEREIKSWPSILGSSSLRVLQTAVRSVSYRLTDIVGHTFKNGGFQLKVCPMSQIKDYAADCDAEGVAICLEIGEALPGQAIFTLSLADAMLLVDNLLGEAPGTTTSLGKLEKSALAEVGNLTLSAFLNVLVKNIGSSLQPSPPVVKADKLANVFDEATKYIADLLSDLLLIKADFVDSENNSLIQFWILPDPVSVWEIQESFTYGG